MALLHDSRFVAQDSAGNPYNAATLTVYTANTTTLASTYTTSALTTPLTNPVVANSLGIFPQVFVPEGFTYDVLLKTSGGVTLKTWDDVPSLGPEASTFVRDFGSGGRIEITGVADQITLRAGSPSPDNTGGNLIIEGWAGTQLDYLQLDAANTQFSGKLTSVGSANLELGSGVDLTVLGGKYYGDLVMTAPTAFAAVTLVDIPLASGIDVSEIDIYDIEGAFTLLDLRVSFDSGATFKAAAADYTFTRLTGSGSAAGSDEDPAVVNDRIRVGNHTNITGLRTCVKLEVITTSTASKATQVNFRGLASSDLVFGTGHTKNSYGRATHVRLFINTATFSGRYRVVGKKGW